MQKLYNVQEVLSMITSFIIMGLVVLAFPPAIIIFIIYKICDFISDVNHLNKEKKRRLIEQEETKKRAKQMAEQKQILREKKISERKKWEEIERNALKRNAELREQDEQDNYEQYKELSKW